MNKQSDRNGGSLVLVALSAALVSWTGALAADPPAGNATNGATSTPTQMVDALNLVFGKQTDNRAVHAKGIVLEGRFVPRAAAATLSTAPHFQKPVRLTLRFSNFAGIATISDTDGLANPRGLALKFHLADGSETDLVTHSFNGFPTPTTDDFRNLLVALGTSPPSAPHPTPAEQYLGAHPIAKNFLEGQKPPPVSYATVPYFGVNTFKFTNAKGASVYGRYRIVPLAGEHFLTAEQIKVAAPGYLAEEIRRRVALGLIRFEMFIQLAAEGDKLEDPSIAWPDSRKQVDVGRIEISSVASDSSSEERKLIFLPARLPAGIEGADPMIAARSAAYPVSFTRRHQQANN